MAAGGANPVNAAEGEMAGSTGAPLKPGAPKE